MSKPDAPSDPNRRMLLGGVAGAAGLASVAAQAAAAAPRRNPQPTASGASDMILNINGRDHRLKADVRTSLLDALREHLHLTGAKKGCDQGQCGACTVHIDGKRELACLTLAVAAQGRRIDTIEGLAGAEG